MTKDYPWGKGTPKWVLDAAANDSDKSFIVPAGKIWDVKAIHIEIATTATVGNRSLIAIFTNGTSTVFASPRTANIAASNTGVLNLSRHYAAMGSTSSNAPLLSGVAPGGGMYGTLPDMLLPAGYVIRAYDIGAIDAGADDMPVVLHYVEYDA